MEGIANGGAGAGAAAVIDHAGALLPRNLGRGVGRGVVDYDNEVDKVVGDVRQQPTETLGLVIGRNDDGNLESAEHEGGSVLVAVDQEQRALVGGAEQVAAEGLAGWCADQERSALISGCERASSS